MSVPTRDSPKRSSDDPIDAPTSRGALLLAGLAIALIKFVVPFGRVALYPFTLTATWVHEMGHGIAALLVGGRFDRLEIFADASGLAHTIDRPGWRDAIVCVGGLLAPPIVGAAMFALARGPRRARIVLAALAALMFASIPIWVRTVTGIVAIASVAALTATFAWRGSPRARLVMAQFLAITLALDTVSRSDYLFTSSAMVGGERRASDIQRVADALGGPFIAWGLLVAIVGLALLAVGLRIAWWMPDDRVANPAIRPRRS
jgi:hypothetical protein